MLRVIPEATEPDELTVIVQKVLDSTYESEPPAHANKKPSSCHQLHQQENPNIVMNQDAVQEFEQVLTDQKEDVSTNLNVPEDHANTKASSCHEIHKHDHRHIAMNPNAVQDHEQVLRVQEADASTHLNDDGCGVVVRSRRKRSKRNIDTVSGVVTEDVLTENDHVQQILIKIDVVLSARVEAGMEIKEAMSKFPDDEEFKEYKNQLDDMFKERACNTTHDTHSSGLKDHSTAKNDGQPSTYIVVSQPSGFNENPLPKIWLSPGFIEAVDKVVENTISTSKRKRPYAAITPPKFDLGISPIKQSEPLSMVLHEEAECNVSEDATKYQVERATRRELKLGDHLRSPFVIRAVDLNVTPEERRIHEWAVAGLGGKYELLFSTPNDTTLHRHAIEILGRTTTIYVSVIDAWATLLNYEERYRNRDSLRRYFFSTEVMVDTKLRSKSVNHNTQYALFKKGLLSCAKNNWEVVQMRNVDLVFFPLLEKGHYYLVVFNLKNPSVVVIDNRYQEVSDDDQLLQMYDFITDIMQRLMIRHLNVVGHPARRELDEIGQERLRMDWQTRNNFDDYGVFAMRHMETYMGDVRTWNTGLSKEGKTQEIQIASLRMKYVAKLLVSNYNKKKEYVVKEVEKFQTMDEDIRKKLRKHADDTKTGRL
ncbi:hypothetical protein Ccrd_006691 [Cynara cardunculus var. scolymus]|uniref:Peptidase C48, SUMO/Sentrin/Ubl1 n=1 Tax=Cynara cardunculus var. scolymus TaxID=59895 RepID=A0A103XIC7_CYNCS|nr:hypothetical protein Ccrd_006691 [Cynara cardunculus var. scolymus]